MARRWGETDDATERTCSRCNTTKPMRHYRYGMRGAGTICHECRAELKRQWRKANPGYWKKYRDKEYHRRYMREWNRRNTKVQKPPRSWLNAIQAGIALGISETWVRELAKGGQLGARRFGQIWYIPPEGLRAYEGRGRTWDRTLGARRRHNASMDTAADASHAADD